MSKTSIKFGNLSNDDEYILGFTEYDNNKYSFIYENSTLILLPTDKTNISQKISLKDFFDNINNKKEAKWIKNQYIFGTYNFSNPVIFYVKGSPSFENGFLIFEVLFYYYDTHEKSSKNLLFDSFYATGQEIDCFFNPATSYGLKFNDYNDYSIALKQADKFSLGQYEYQNITIKVYISAVAYYNTKDLKQPLTAKSRIYFYFSEAKDIDFVYDVYYHLKNFLCFVCNRKNISIDCLKLHEVSDKNNYYLGNLINLYDEADIENNEKCYEKVIKYEYLKENSSKIFSSISDDSLYFENKPTSIDDATHFRIDRIILNFVAFEREFENTIKSEPRSEDYQNFKMELENILDELVNKNTGKKKKYAKFFKQALININDNNFQNRLSKALNKYKDVLNPFLNCIYGEYSEKTTISEFSKRMGKLRNDSVHGNIDLKIFPEHIWDFQTIQILLYAMRLDFIGLDKTEIQNSIKDLFNFSIHIGSEQK